MEILEQTGAGKPVQGEQTKVGETAPRTGGNVGGVWREQEAPSTRLGKLRELVEATKQRELEELETMLVEERMDLGGHKEWHSMDSCGVTVVPWIGCPYDGEEEDCECLPCERDKWPDRNGNRNRIRSG
eukprot:TRINITY_DN2290_c0_g1_i5.p4 TRINITY_DN2290_c0_g1~~TRINITY_DN2290_c0_g1_i5.p4  ORF type:complete len:129 (+),score=9.36 TRINITY_DN2290_c0_g1_i5:406-792(+)